MPQPTPTREMCTDCGERPIKIKYAGLCNRCYQRWQRSQHEAGLPTRRTPEDRFWDTVEFEVEPRWGRGVCYTWMNRAFRFFFEGAEVNPAVWIYEREKGKLPEGKALITRCGNARCVRPSHQKVVSHEEMLVHSGNPWALNASKTKCKNGHPLSGDNLYERPNGSRDCRTCAREATRSWRRRQRESS